MSGKQKVLLGITLAALLLCSAGAIYGYTQLWPRWQEHNARALEEEIVANLEQTLGMALALDTAADGQVRLAADDLDFSSVHDDSGESGLDVTNNDATIINAYVEILPDGIHVYLADMQLDGMPAIVDGAFALTGVHEEAGLTGKLFGVGGIERGLTQGINTALDNASLRPVKASIEDGMLVIEVADSGTLMGRRTQSRIT